MATSVPVDTKIFTGAMMTEADRKAYRYVNGNRTDECTGVSIPVVLPALKFEKCNVRIDDPNHILLFPEGVEFPDAPPMVTFEGLEAVASSSRDEFGVTIRATAKNARLANTAAPAASAARTAPAASKDDK